MRKIPTEEIKKKVKAVLGAVQLEGFEERYPRQLSGGQQQRIALARAIVLEPDILLLDEPLSNLDALLREQMRFEIAQIHKRLGITTLYVTHDQTEAMVISDRIVILSNGRIMQDASPADIYLRPANKFVAGFMGTTSFLEGVVTEVQGDRIKLTTNDGDSARGTRKRTCGRSPGFGGGPPRNLGDPYFGNKRRKLFFGEGRKILLYRRDRRLSTSARELFHPGEMRYPTHLWTGRYSRCKN